MNKQGIAKRIRQRRTELGLSQGQLAQRAGWTRAYGSTLENGSGYLPSWSTLEKAAEALDLTFGEFLLPIIWPEDAEAAHKQAVGHFTDTVSVALDHVRETYLSKLERKDAQDFLAAVSNLMMHARREQLLVILAMLQSAAEVVVGSALDENQDELKVLVGKRDSKLEPAIAFSMPDPHEGSRR